jgi:hypothetical protein
VTEEDITAVGLPHRYQTEVIAVTGRGGLYGCEMLRIENCLHNRLTDGGKPYAPAAALLHRNIFLLLLTISVRG